MKTYRYQSDSSYQPPQERILLILALLGCGLSLMPLPLLFLKLWPINLSVPFLVTPALLLLIALWVYVSKRESPTFWPRYSVGFTAGFIATLAYDFIRVFGLAFRFPGFAVINKFGILMTGQEHATAYASFMGWSYHFMNGGIFGIVYALIAAPGTVLRGVIWALLLEIGMVVSYPNTFGIDMSWGTTAFTFSMLGHIAYGSVLGYRVKQKLSHAPAEVCRETK